MTCEEARRVEAIKRENMTALERYRRQLRENPRLLYLFFELTDACNLSCLHCGSGCSPEKRQFLPFDWIRKVLDGVAAAYDPKGIMVCLSGGEPMLHPRFYEIAKYATSLGFYCGITTNATMIDSAGAARLAEAGVQSVSVSLDGLEDTHNWLRNSETAFDRAVAGIRNMVAFGKKKYCVQATTVVHGRNIGQLEEMYPFVRSLGVDSWRLVNVEPIGRAAGSDGLLLEQDGYLRLLRFIREKRFDPENPMEVTFGCSHYVTVPFENMVRKHYFLCGSGIFVASVLVNGDIYSCMDIQRRPELVQGNVRKDDFVWVWENRFEAFRQDRTELCDRCKSCDQRLFCGGDSAHTWDYDRNEPMLCLKEILEKEL